MCKTHDSISLIEIFYYISSIYIFYSQRAYSNKTRIKTELPNHCFEDHKLKEYFPIKQGLRRDRSVLKLRVQDISKSIFQ